MKHTDSFTYMGNKGIIARLADLSGLAIMLFMTMNCTQEKDGKAYIGPSDIKIEDGKMTPEVLLAFGRLSDPQLSPDGNTILYGVSYTSVEENRSCRNLFIVNADGTDRKQLTKEGNSISCARWINGGKGIAYIQKGQLWTAEIRGLGGTSPKLVKKTRISDIPAGISEFKISPDGSKVMYISTVHSDVKTPADTDPALGKATAYVAEDLMYRHWDHWVTELPHTFIASFSAAALSITPDSSRDILENETALYELPAEPFGGIEQLDWNPDGSLIAYSCRKKTGKQYAFSTDTEIYIYNTANGGCSVIPMGGGYDTDPVWSPDGKRIAWISMERDGYEADKTRLMVADLKNTAADGLPEIGEITDLTAGFKYNAAGPVWSTDGSAIYFNALAEGIQGIFKAGLTVCDGKTGLKEISRITGDDQWFDFNSPFALKETDKGTELLASYCSMDFPTELVRICESDGSHTDITTENQHILSQLLPHRTEARMIKTVDGKDMLTWVVYPPEFDPAKEYPSILICLGGPQGTLSQGWSYRWNYRLMAAQGYVVVLPNRRGTTAFGQEWTEQISGDYPGLNMQDYLAAAKELKSEPYIGKMAACGASYGGYSVYYLAGIHEDVFDCFIAHAGIFDERYMYYETEEMWFPNWDNGGLEEFAYTPGQTGPAGDGKTFGGIRQGGSPWSSNPKAVRHYANSPAANVTKWHTPILCIHGAMDFRIPYDQGIAAFNAAQMMGVPSKLIVFPDECHWILKPQNALFWHREYYNWLDRWCK
ncbi:MAG: prolyl oligopeptidase family serine peptidase [Candidatus Cryptobacteroides sp.]|nr:S9 family peptidase [Bacteroidales bacterium]